MRGWSNFVFPLWPATVSRAGLITERTAQQDMIIVTITTTIPKKDKVDMTFTT